MGTNSPVTSRLFVQEAVGGPLTFVGCVGLRGLVIDPRQQDYARFVTEKGVEVAVIPRYPNPTPFDVTFGLNFRKWRSLFAKTKQGCHPNFFLASANCEDEKQVPNPNYWDDGIWVYDVTPNSGYQVGNNTLISRDPSQSALREDQISMTHNFGAFVGKMTYGETGTVPAVDRIHSVAVVDEGKCSQVICRPCDAEGCLDMLINVGSDYMYSIDGGSNWVNIATSGAGTAQAFNGNAFMVNAGSILVSADVSAALADWTTATTDVAFSELSNIVQIDYKTLIVGGDQSAVWRSTNGGSVWTQIRVATTGYPDIMKMAYNKDTEQLVAIGKDGTDTIFMISTDHGKNWTMIDTHPVPAETWGANSNPVVVPAGPNNYLSVNGNLYKLSCDHSVITYTALTLIGVTGNVTGVGLVDGSKNPNGVWVTTGAAGVFKIWRSNDGLNTIQEEALTFTITGGSTVTNPFALCSGKYGDSLVIAFGPHLYYGRDWESFFAE